MSKTNIILVILLFVTFLVPFFAAQNFSPASDEITHLPSGYSYWKTGLITLNPQHPPLVKLFSSFPLLFMDLNFDKEDPNIVGPLIDEWEFGRNFIFSNDADKILLWGRMFPILLSVLLGFYIFKWASEIFSVKAGLLALFLYAFMPNMIAHAQFVTTDVALAAFSFITLYYLWRFFKFSDNKSLIYTGISLGLALGSKYSAIILIPIMSLLLLLYIWKKELPLHKKIRKLFNYSFVIGLLAFGILYVLYLLPLDFSFYLRGIGTVYADWDQTYRYFLNGQFSQEGWWYYFIFAFLIKTPIPALVAFVLALALYKEYRFKYWDKFFIFIPIIIFLFFVSAKAHNIGIRYLLPIYPFLMLYAGGLADLDRFQYSNFLRKKALFILVGSMGIWYIFSAAAIYPDYIAYFNEAVGGAKNGHKYLDDSNIEWKHDLKRLAIYQNENPDTKIIYSWQHSSPEYYGLKNLVELKKDIISNPSGRYAINTHFLVRLKNLSQIDNNPLLDWLSLKEPIDKIGYSFYIYEF